jgi:molybdopterin-binding protein
VYVDLLTPKEAAKLLTVSYPTIKQWIYAGKIHSVKTPGGHHRIPRSEIGYLMGRNAARGRALEERSSLNAISGRNKLRGTITQVRVEGLLAQIAIDVGGQTIISIITSNACRELGLKKGMRAIALIKATEVMVIRA